MINKIENSPIKIFNIKVDELFVYHIAGLSLIAWIFSTIFLIFTFGDADGVILYLIITLGYPVILFFQLLLLLAVYWFKKKNMMLPLEISSLLSMMLLPLCVITLYCIA